MNELQALLFNGSPPAKPKRRSKAPAFSELQCLLFPKPFDVPRVGRVHLLEPKPAKDAQ